MGNGPVEASPVGVDTGFLIKRMLLPDFSDEDAGKECAPDGQTLHVEILVGFFMVPILQGSCKWDYGDIRNLVDSQKTQYNHNGVIQKTIKNIKVH